MSTGQKEGGQRESPWDLQGLLLPGSYFRCLVNSTGLKHSSEAKVRAGLHWDSLPC